MRSKRKSFLQIIGTFVFCICLPVFSVLAEEPKTTDPLPEGTEAALKQLQLFRLPEGMKVELFAADPQLYNPVAICVDEKNRLFVAEEFRFNRGTEEYRTRPFLLEGDLQSRTVEDRLRLYEKFADKFEGGLKWFTEYTDQVRLLEDRDGDGRADHSTVFAKNFNDPLDGLAAGVIARDGDVYLTCIPNLWLLRDTDGDGQADFRKSLHRGFGVNCAFLGHDLHGLAWGPDGKLYFSVGDRGYHIETSEGRVLHGPRTGAVFRCDADGSHLQVIYRGLRNPQELAFDKYGNLFAADNNCDTGDKARLVYIIEGGDSGWNMAYQTIPEPYRNGPWHAEKMWYLQNEDQPAWIIPPVGYIGAGPSGFAYYSGQALPPQWRDQFYMCNYTGNGGIEVIRTATKGAGFEIVETRDFFKPIQATDIEFGYDGKVYVSDFVKLDWNVRSFGGRIYTAFDPVLIESEEVKQVASLFRAGFNDRDDAELFELLAHDDMRVRQRAQFALASRGVKSIAGLQEIALKHENQMARLHALWALGQIGSRPIFDSEERAALSLLPTLFKDEDVEIRSHAARLAEHGDLTDDLIGLLNDPSPRVQMFAAQSLGKSNEETPIEPLFALLERNNDVDPWVRHAATHALGEIGGAYGVTDKYLEGIEQRHRSVRLAILLVLRDQVDARIARFLHDPDAEIVVEAARAINDVPIEKAFEADEDSTKQLAELARLLMQPDVETGEVDALQDHPFRNLPIPDPLARRVINANFRLGRQANLENVIAFAESPRISVAVRREALSALSDWNAPPQRDRVNWFWRPVPPRESPFLNAVLTAHVTSLVSSTPAELQSSLIEVLQKHGVQISEATVVQWVSDEVLAAPARIAALHLLVSMKANKLDSTLQASLKSENVRLRAAALDIFAKSQPQSGLQLIRRILDSNDAAVIERQQSLDTLAKLETDDAKALLRTWIEKLRDGSVPNDLQLDVLKAAQSSKDQATAAIVKQFEQSLAADSGVAKFKLALHGGDTLRGREIFFNHQAAQCIRCHKLDNFGGTAGPDLSEVAQRNPENLREYLLQSIVDPSAKFAKGFETVVLELDNGTTVAGRVIEETDASLTIETAELKQVKIDKRRIEDRFAGKSAMPSVAEQLSLSEIRDLVEFLSHAK